jgi:hypothetical protein
MTKRFKSAAVAAAVAGSVVAVSSVLLAPAASADVKVVLPAQKQVKKLGDGTVITVSRSGERATINPSMGGTPLHRNAWVSGKYKVTSSAEPKKIEIQAGYIVGCQVNFGGGTMGGGAGAVGLSDQSVDEGDLGVGGSGTLTLGPGQAQGFFINDVEYADDFGSDAHDPYVTYTETKSARLSYVNSQIGLRGCAGYAQARSWLRAMVETEFAQETLNFYGRPFSLG